MSDSTTTSPQILTPSPHQSGVSVTANGSSAQLISQLDDCRQQLSMFSEEMSQELNDILSILSPERASQNLHNSLLVDDATESLPTTHMEEQPPELPAYDPPVEKLPSSTIEPIQPAPAGDEQSRLAALKARIADRLRNEMEPTNSPTQQGGDQ